MHGVMLWRRDKPDTHLSTLVTWEDQRVTRDFVRALVRKTRDLPAARLISVLKSGYGCATLAHMAAHAREELNRYDCAGTVMDYVVCLLCGAQDTAPVMEPTSAHRCTMFRVFLCVAVDGGCAVVAFFGCGPCLLCVR